MLDAMCTESHTGGAIITVLQFLNLVLPRVMIKNLKIKAFIKTVKPPNILCY